MSEGFAQERKRVALSEGRDTENGPTQNNKNNK